jgi:hypothetical protein
VCIYIKNGIDIHCTWQTVKLPESTSQSWWSNISSVALQPVCEVSNHPVLSSLLTWTLKIKKMYAGTMLVGPVTFVSFGGLSVHVGSTLASGTPKKKHFEYVVKCTIYKYYIKVYIHVHIYNTNNIHISIQLFKYIYISSCCICGSLYIGQ